MHRLFSSAEIQDRRQLAATTATQRATEGFSDPPPLSPLPHPPASRRLFVSPSSLQRRHRCRRHRCTSTVVTTLRASSSLQVATDLGSQLSWIAELMSWMSCWIKLDEVSKFYWLGAKLSYM
ncbi:hypothetical protein LWI29_028130 [Acer saccharum]|uniref:Uncharacterized protein n=1 Tax=Acer saccharum TaxID=4024 RepID=A0AA39T6U4_ACESA|nr:hypothetical protein LWI29_028130 [Acer saccharum]